MKPAVMASDSILRRNSVTLLWTPINLKSVVADLQVALLTKITSFSLTAEFGIEPQFGRPATTVFRFINGKSHKASLAIGHLDALILHNFPGIL